MSAEPPSPIKPSEPNTKEVLIIGTGFGEPGNPTALVKHSAKEELIEKCKVKFDIANYSHLSISEVLSDYLNQVHTSRNLEIDVVKHMHQKYEEASTQFQFQLADVKNRLELQEAKTRKADSKFKFSLDEAEKLKTGFNTEKPPGLKKKLP